MGILVNLHCGMFIGNQDKMTDDEKECYNKGCNRIEQEIRADVFALRALCDRLTFILC